MGVNPKQQNKPAEIMELIFNKRDVAALLNAYESIVNTQQKPLNSRRRMLSGVGRKLSKKKIIHRPSTILVKPPKKLKEVEYKDEVVAVPKGKPYPARFHSVEYIESREASGSPTHDNGKGYPPFCIYYSVRNMWYAQCKMKKKQKHTITLRSGFPNPHLLVKVLTQKGFKLDENQVFKL